MKNNWLGVLLGIFCASFSSLAFSLGLGGITTNSAINEPLIAEIELINVGDLENSQILVGIGTDSDYELAGVSREFFHSDLRFEVQAEGVAQPRIVLRSREPLQDPYLNFIVQVRWPQGKLLREYTVLLDMPIFSKQDTVVSAPQPAAASGGPRTAREAVAQQRQNPQQGTQQAAPPRQPTSGRSTANVGTGQAYRVSTGDTLWGLAGDVAASTGASRHQAMLSIHERNPSAFVDGDINRLKAGVELRVPSEAQMSSRSEGQAFRDFTSLKDEAAATPIQSTTDDINRIGNQSDSGQAGRLALTSASDSGSGGSGTAAKSEAEVAAEKAANEALTTTLAENAILKEQLDASDIERQEFEDRIANLEEQINLLQEERALQIEGDSLSAVQEVAVEEEAPVAVPPSEPETLMDKLYNFRYWIFGVLAIIVVIALLILLLVLKQRKSSDVDELYYDEDEALDTADEFEQDFLDEEEAEEEDEDEELEDGIDEITKELSDDELDDDLEEEVEIEEDDDELTSDEEGFEDASEVLVAESFEGAEEDDDELFERGEFEDLDEFFSDESSGATDVLFRSEDSDDAVDGSMGEQADESQATESDDTGTDEDQDLLDFNVEDLETPAAEEPDVSAVDDDNSLEFEIGEMALGDASESSTADEIDLEDKFGYTEDGITSDLDAEAEAAFEESIEVHSSEMDDLLVPADGDLEGDDLVAGDSSESDDDEHTADSPLGEEIEDDTESLLEEEPKDEGSILDVDEDLNLDEDMDADLADLDLGDDDLGEGDADEELLTKLELAEAYIEMGDVQGAKELLSEVEKDGNAEQKAAAQSMLEGLKD